MGFGAVLILSMGTRENYWEYLVRANRNLELADAWKRLRPSELCDQLGCRFEIFSLVYADDDSQELFDRLDQSRVWAWVPSNDDPFYSIQGFGPVHRDDVSFLRAKQSFRTKSTPPTSDQLALITELSNQFAEVPDKFMSLVDDLSPLEFEEFVADILNRRGYATLLTPATNDNGVDIFAVLHAGGRAEPGNSVVVQCKKTRRTVGVRIVRELAGAKLLHNAEKALLVTTSHFSPKAREIVDDPMYYGIDLVDFEILRAWWLSYGGYTPTDLR